MPRAPQLDNPEVSDAPAKPLSAGPIILAFGARARAGALKIAFAAAVGVAVWWIVWDSPISSATRTGRTLHWSQNVLVPIGILAFAALVVLRHERHWAAPTRKLRELLPRVRGGDAAIDELADVKGGLIGIVPEIQQLLRELRQQRLAVAELHEEVRQRVATRTDALERKIGSLRAQAVRDALTTLYNRRMFERVFPQLVKKCRAEATDLCLIMFDVDDFKLLNDTLGHSAGDELLRDLGRLIRSSLRDEQDLGFRYGGDEFAILLPGMSADAGGALAERMTSLVDRLVKPLKVARKPRLSAGIAALAELDEPSASALLCAADKQLYATKSARKSDLARVDLRKAS
jgi:diguanylate cyclase (GGDEF)-like protein